MHWIRRSVSCHIESFVACHQVRFYRSRQSVMTSERVLGYRGADLCLLLPYLLHKSPYLPSSSRHYLPRYKIIDAICIYKERNMRTLLAFLRCTDPSCSRVCTSINSLITAGEHITLPIFMLYSIPGFFVLSHILIIQRNDRRGHARIKIYVARWL